MSAATGLDGLVAVVDIAMQKVLMVGVARGQRGVAGCVQWAVIQSTFRNETKPEFLRATIRSSIL